tara:strand:+ start:303 stop:623 length:321 start_codon:yes stop_codon:yes gene_type:complete
MIPFIRSHKELMLITNSRDKMNIRPQKENLQSLEEDSGQRKRYINSIDKNSIKLPSLPHNKRTKWIKGKEAVSKFFDELDYNNQIQPTYEITLLERQQNYSDHNVA